MRTLALLLLPSLALAQPRPIQPPPPGRPPGVPGVPAGAPPPGPVGGKTIAPTNPPAAEQTSAKLKPSCEEVRRKAKFNIYFDKVELEKLVQTVADATCKTFILGENVRGKISIIGPENGKVEVTGEQFYAAFLAALDANSLAVYEHGKFLKIVDKQRAKQNPIPTILDPNQEYTLNEQMVTKLFKIKYVELEALRGVLQQLVSPSGDTIPFQPDVLIVNDIGSNMHRIERIVDQLDTRNASDEIKVLQIQYATAQEIADKIQKLFETKAAKPGQRQGAAPIIAGQPPPPGASAAGVPAEGGSGGPATLSQLIPDERTNKLIIVASPAALDRILALIREIDIPISGEGKINVYYLENANAEDVASTLQSLAQGTANKPKTPAIAPPPGAASRGVTAAELFQGEVKISADKATNALVVVASQNDYRSLVRVIEKLDIQRRQVFVEAVIMEVNLDRTSELGVNLHTGIPLHTDQGDVPVLLGTKYTSSGLPPSFSITNLASFGGFLAGLQGPAIPSLAKLGINIPQFGVLLDALQTQSDVNVISTPHILTTDNEDAEITVGQNVPFQSGFSAGGLGGLGGLGSLAGAVPGLNTGALGGLAGGLGGLGGLAGGLGGFGTPFGAIQRTNVDLKLSIKPQISGTTADYVRLVIQLQNEEIASQDPVLGPTTSKRAAKTTVVAKDQETVVIGGIMQDRRIEGVSKVPLLGDIPILGHLFRKENTHKVKTNLLIFLTPYIIRDSSDFRRIFERKMRERQQFVEQFYGAATGYDVAIDFNRKAGPLGRMTQLLNREMNKVENGGTGTPGEKVYTPVPNGPVGGPTAPAPGTPSPGAAPAGGAAQPGQPGAEPKVNEPPPPPGETPPVPSPERLQPQPPAPGELR